MNSCCAQRISFKIRLNFKEKREQGYLNIHTPARVLFMYEYNHAENL